MGKKSMKSKLTELGFDPDKIFEALKGIPTLKEAAKKFDKLTKGKLSIHPYTIIRTLQRDEAKSEDYPFLAKVENGTGKRGRVSTKDILEQHYKKSLWDVIRKDCTKGSCIEAVAAKLQGASGKNVTTPTLLRTVEKGIEDGEVTNKDWFFHWAKPKRKRNTSGTTTNGNGKRKELAYAMKYTCRECGYAQKAVVVDEGCLHDNFSLSLIARRCPKCNKWKTFLVEGEVDGIPIRKAVVPIKEFGYEWDGEAFVDKDMKHIDNPLTQETQDRFNESGKILLRKAERDRRIKENPHLKHSRHLNKIDSSVEQEFDEGQETEAIDPDGLEKEVLGMGD